jgi:hypothetical protein
MFATSSSIHRFIRYKVLETTDLRDLNLHDIARLHRSSVQKPLRPSWGLSQKPRTKTARRPVLNLDLCAQKFDQCLLDRIKRAARAHQCKLGWRQVGQTCTDAMLRKHGGRRQDRHAKPR